MLVNTRSVIQGLNLITDSQFIRDFRMGHGSPGKPGIGGEILPGQKFKQHSIYPPGEGEPAPAWITFDRQVLSFDAYFHEMVVPTGSFQK